MARLVAVCRENEEDYPFLARQIPLYIDDSLTMVMEFSDGVLDVDRHVISSSHWKQFTEGHSKLKQQDLTVAVSVVSREVCRALSQLVPCVGCRRSVERLFSHLVESGTPALEPLALKPAGMLSVTKACLADAKKLYRLFYVQGSKLNDVIDAIPKSKKSNRCQLHSLDTNKLRPLGGSWMDVWERMSQECRDEVVLVDSACLLETLETHLQKHRFCSDCKNKVLRAYNILVGEVDSSEEKDYCAALYEGLCCCPREHHIHVCYETDFIAHLLSRAEPEFAGAYEERHAKTIDVAQEEVLTCLGIHLYERLHRIWQKLRAEEQTWQILFHVGIDELRKSFETAVEKMQGISRLEQFVEELSEKERAKQLKQEKKRQKRKNRRRNRCGFEISDREAEIKEKSHDEGSLKSEEGSCTACRSHDEGENISSNASAASSCPDKRDSTGSDYGYSSSIEGSESGSREGSDIACSEGLCNHDEAGEPNEHNYAEDKEEEATDSCVDCWTHSEEKPQCKSKKKKRKGSGLRNNQGHKDESHSVPSSHVCQTKDLNSSLCGEKMDSFAQQSPWAVHGKNLLSLNSKPSEANISLSDLLEDSEAISDEENCLTQDEIQAFLERNRSFYNNRQKYRQLLKEKFSNYCCLRK
ncbi:gametogenetin-binding protein 2 [Phyllopteryx taeniolatus]|uniref:gametogenetin-binding protein 2 n=1 Tax=Phyllopteryx taeniolatus TaxID=161469 RepID=UPI002AD311BC|nr:gametogenetin-binding protein 2 [Phyllopteryx taeniolatus]XP_061608101.1 gametogenetin-binding protein 2 [Phyllopteryx taeniolatus]XP_061608102.1 gametogenetin-binding protein 2 [Phyllopteryx taeniolatus]